MFSQLAADLDRLPRIDPFKMCFKQVPAARRLKMQGGSGLSSAPIILA
jgi:hypothetical protein